MLLEYDFGLDARLLMKRDMDVIREIVLAVSEASDPISRLEGISDDAFAFHAQLLEEAGLIEAAIHPKGKRIAEDALIWRLTWAGSDFADSIRSPEVWDKTKSGALAAGGFTVDLLKDLAKGFIKKQIEDLTGVKL